MPVGASLPARSSSVDARLVGEVVHQQQRDRQEGDRRQAAGHDQALVERPLDVAGSRAHGVGADDRRDQRHAADDQRVDRDGAGLAEGQDAEQHHGDRGDGVGLEQVGRHAGAVADVVADVVGDHGRVARVVLGDAGLDLAHEVGADVGRLGEDAAAQTGEDGDQRAAEAEPHERVDRVALVDAGEDQDAVVAGDAQQRQTGDQQAGDRAALEGDLERARDAVASALRYTGVRPHRHVHADEAGRAGEGAADQEADGDQDALGILQLERDREHDREHDGDAGDDRVLPPQVGARALLHGLGDVLHLLVSGRERQQPARRGHAVHHGGTSAHERDHHAPVSQEFQGVSASVNQSAGGAGQFD